MGRTRSRGRPSKPCGWSSRRSCPPSAGGTARSPRPREPPRFPHGKDPAATRHPHGCDPARAPLGPGTRPASTRLRHGSRPAARAPFASFARQVRAPPAPPFHQQSAGCFSGGFMLCSRRQESCAVSGLRVRIALARVGQTAAGSQKGAHGAPDGGREVFLYQESSKLPRLRFRADGRPRMRAKGAARAASPRRTGSAARGSPPRRPGGRRLRSLLRRR
jgi:hypothetical protein